MRNNIEKGYKCACNKPEVRDSFMNGCCSDDQIIKCYGKIFTQFKAKRGLI